MCKTFLILQFWFAQKDTKFTKKDFPFKDLERLRSEDSNPGNVDDVAGAMMTIVLRRLEQSNGKRPQGITS
jgi:hypothetical protein